ncbi:unnamed protein product [Orchesella dallaii]|uniref:Uncharacterized protein n=1 Tax=Orchesella dallaii TaxID=48710 RepID=A0ABP1PWD8_9HEXA
MLKLLFFLIYAAYICHVIGEEDWPALSCHLGYYTPDKHPHRTGEYEKQRINKGCSGYTHWDCQRQCFMKSVYILKRGDKREDPIKLRSEQEIGKWLQMILFNFTEPNDSGFKIAKRIIAECTSEHEKLADKPCEDLAPFNDCVDNIWVSHKGFNDVLNLGLHR